MDEMNHSKLRRGHLLLLLTGVGIGVFLGQLVLGSHQAVADQASLGIRGTIHVSPAGAGTSALIIDTSGFAWTVDCANSGGVRPAPSGKTVVDGREMLTYHSFRTADTYIWVDGEFVELSRE
jgi:hypothetical protein